MKRIRFAMVVGILTFGVAGCGEETPISPAGDIALETAGGRGPAIPSSGHECDGLPTAPLSQRVDLYTPTFANPTSVTNPLFPISELDRVLLLGTVDGGDFRTETTLLSQTQTIELEGRTVEALVSQYVAWLDRRIHEVAIDWYVQDDLGAVWYLGEDVFNYDEGRVEDTEGTWLAGKDGPEAMIMPPDPQVGDVWRPENICGFVFEEVTATATGVTVPGPQGQVSGALVVSELHMDATTEDKIFAPGYGEFSTGSPGSDIEALALAVQIDALAGPPPAELEALSSGAARIFRAARARKWNDASDTVEDMADAWAAFQALGFVPPLLDAEMETALEYLVESVDDRDIEETRQASIDVARASLDLQLRHLSRDEIDLAQIDLWVRQLLVDAAAHDLGAIRGDIVSIGLIRDRFAHPPVADIDAQIRAVQSAALAANLSGATEAAVRLQNALARSSRGVPRL
ncbi:MAG TPA: hypothetical protein VEY33_06285 [Gemmatimonadota bacterium]|nr:hypothetical protein [Gemmatimonadota bacterium]